MNWGIKNWRENTGEGKRMGWFTLIAGDLEINDCVLVNGPKGKFIGFPQRSYEKDGETKYTSVVWMPDEKRRYAFQDWCVKELDKFVGVEPDPEKGTEDDNIPF